MDTDTSQRSGADSMCEAIMIRLVSKHVAATQWQHTRMRELNVARRKHPSKTMHCPNR
jgi:hypothetical protein